MNINDLYFNALLKRLESKTDSLPIVLHEPENHRISNVIPTATASQEQLELIPLTSYSDLEEPDVKVLNQTNFLIQKMQAGLGTSLKRKSHMAQFTQRKKLGSKGTDLFLKTPLGVLSLAEISMIQVLQKSEKKLYKKIFFQEFVNEDTIDAISELWQKKCPINDTKYEHIFKANNFLERLPNFCQVKQQTIDEVGKLTSERIAPAGHGLFGFKTFLECFKGEVTDQIVTIGNGEDLSSTPDDKAISWVAKNEIPIVMITTTKTIDDKKGGQISLVTGKIPYVTIIEKAQAEQSGQVEYFEKLGLRKGDRESYFNTNVVVINTKALKKIFNQYINNLSEDDFVKLITPDVIQNVKTQQNKKYTQLEAAIGSVILNLDRNFRQKFNHPLVQFLNYSAQDRFHIFNPLKTFEDFEKLSAKNLNFL